MFTRALLFCFSDFAPRSWGMYLDFFQIRLRADRIVPCQRIVIRYPSVLTYIRIIIENPDTFHYSRESLFVIMIPNIITYHVIYNKASIAR